MFGGYRSDDPEYGIEKIAFLEHLRFGVDKYNAYQKFLLAGDFNIPENDEVLIEFMSELDSKCLIKDPTCFKSTENPSKIDLFITNCPFWSPDIGGKGTYEFTPVRPFVRPSVRSF